jgi:hypothetical protein
MVGIYFHPLEDKIESHNFGREAINLPDHILDKIPQDWQG